MERSGQVLARAATVFFNLVGANTNDAREKIETEMSPKLSAHSDCDRAQRQAVRAHQGAVRQARQARPGRRVEAPACERYHTDFVRAGAQLVDADKDTLKAINGELAALGTKFSQNVLKEVNASAIVVDTREELDGFTDEQIAAAAEAAKSAQARKASTCIAAAQHHRPAAASRS